LVLRFAESANSWLVGFSQWVQAQDEDDDQFVA
jgi:hypothetical protein